MKTKLLKLALCAVGLLTSVVSTSAQSWDFEKTAFTATELANIKADGTSIYSQNTENTRYTYVPVIDNASLKAQSTELDFTKGLKFVAKANGIRLYSNYALELTRHAINSDATTNATASYVIIPNVPKGATVTIKFKSNNTNTVQIVSDDLTNISSPATTSDDTYTGTVKAAGDVKIGYKVTVDSNIPVCQIRSISYTGGDTSCSVSTSTFTVGGANPDESLTGSSTTGTWTNSGAFSFTLTVGSTSSGSLVRNTNSYRMPDNTIPVNLNKNGGTDGIYEITKSPNIKSVTLYAKNTADTEGGTIYADFKLATQTQLCTTLPTRSSTTPSSFDITNYSNIRVAQGTYVTFAIEYYVSASLSIADIEWASMYLPFDAAIPDGVTAYYANAVNSTTVSLKKIENGIPANTGVVVKGSTGIYEFVYTSTVDEITSNLFEGVTEETPLTDNQNYVLGGSENEKANPVFNLYASGEGTINLAAYKAYLPVSKVPNAGSSRTIKFGFDDDETTGITDVKINTENGTTQYYDLSGRLVTHPTKGLYIVNGKKVIIK